MPYFKKPSVATSVAVFAKKNNKVLLITRLTEPFKNKYAFPGGFLTVDEEDIYDAAVRELAEETGFLIKKEDLVLIDIRSNPKRDPRSHVVDVGLLSVVDYSLEISTLRPEAKSFWLPLNSLDSLEFAFDHNVFAENIKNYIKKIKVT